MTKYRSRQVDIQAMRWDGTSAAAHLIALLAGENFQVLGNGEAWEDDFDVTAICRSDLQGGKWLPMYSGDFVVVDEFNRLFPLRRVIFEERYEQWGD